MVKITLMIAPDAASALLACYGREVLTPPPGTLTDLRNWEIHEQSFAAVTNIQQDPSSAQSEIDNVKKLSDTLPVSFEAWYENADQTAIERRIALQDAMDFHATHLVRLGSLLWRAVGYERLHRLGKGAHAIGYTARRGSEETVIKVVDTVESGPVSKYVENMIHALEVASTVSSFEQPRAAVYWGVVEATRIRGKYLSDLTAKDLQAIPDRHLRRAIRDLRTLGKLGVGVDSIGENGRHHQLAGFGFYDPNPVTPNVDQTEANLKGFGEQLHPSPASRYVKQSAALRQARWEMTDRLYGLAGDVHSDIDPTWFLPRHASPR